MSKHFTKSGKPKRRFNTERQANRALNVIWSNAAKGRQRSDNMPCRAYRCSACKGWHLTSGPKIE